LFTHKQAVKDFPLNERCQSRNVFRLIEQIDQSFESVKQRQRNPAYGYPEAIVIGAREGRLLSNISRAIARRSSSSVNPR
jgi:hypothetical protein